MIIAKAAATLALVFIGFLPKNNPHFKLDSEKQIMLDEVNRLRSKGCHCGRKYMPPVRPLRWSARLEKAALAHARDMERNDFFEHRGSDGSSIGTRADRVGYRWRAVGENIAAGYDSFQDVLLGWKDSPSHCLNLMSSSYTEMGVVSIGGLWVQDLGAPMGR